MKNKISLLVITLLLSIGITACGNTQGNASSSTNAEKSSTTQSSISLKDGTYSADFKSDSSMFKINEALKGKCKVTVENGKATAHITLPSKSIVNLFLGKADDAKKEGAKLINPTVDTVKYEDGLTEEVYGFDVPLEVIDQEFDLALIGTKGNWYDHKVIISNVNPK